MLLEIKMQQLDINQDLVKYDLLSHINVVILLKSQPLPASKNMNNVTSMDPKLCNRRKEY